MHTILRKISLAALFAFICLLPAADCQITGGQHVFSFLNLSPSARITALGGMQIAVKDDDPAFAAANPAALNPAMDGRLALQHNFFISDIQHGYVAYAHDLPKVGFTVQGGLQYVGYGDIPMTDEYGNKLGGNIEASETALTLGAARPLTGRVSLGLNLRVGFSTLDVYKSSALAADAGLMYADTTHRFTAAVVLRNAGTQLSTYDGTREDLPFDLQIGISKRFRHLPFRFGIIAHHLHEWEITYDDPNFQDDDVLIFGGDEPADKGGSDVDNFFRHLIFNGEFLFGRNESFQLRFGYNHLRKKELSVKNYRSLAGFSFGAGVRVSRFRVDFGYGSYHLGGGVVHFGLGTNLKEFF
ncbi:MAG: hypothetical protein EPGJADBJ_02104 [Saprospiraceae bacterium]|nr:hypothetical protein [Saprospiraceae bacterium]